MVKLIKSENYDINYLARVVFINNFEPHPKASRLKIAKVLGFKVLTGIDSKPGKYIYFPVGSRINGEMLSFLGLYKDPSKNKNGEAGSFDNNGRVKMISLRGVSSEGFIIPAEKFKAWVYGATEENSVSEETGNFDTLQWQDKQGTHTIWVVKKYMVKEQNSRKIRQGKGKIPEHLYGLVPSNQFRFHYETLQLMFTPWVIRPDTWIWITRKIDGTSGISSNTLIKRTKSWKFWKPKFEYHRIYASSRTIKSKEINHMAGPGYYGIDVWKYADSVVGPKLWKGMTAYYEIVGYLPNGGFIQKNNDFGCIKPEGTDYVVGRNFRVLVYRITLTSPEGNVHEFNPDQVLEWCSANSLESVKILYSGYAKDLYSEIDLRNHWHENFLDALRNDRSRLGMEELDPECRNEVPVEGIVIRVGNQAYKVKTERHLIRKQQWIEAGYEDPEDIV